MARFFLFLFQFYGLIALKSAHQFKIENIKTFRAPLNFRNIDISFGYSLLLQNGFNETIWVGAPKSDLKNKNDEAVGLYKCQIGSNEPCSKFNIHPENYKPKNAHGTLLGISLDGSDSSGDVFTCAPRSMEYQIRGTLPPFLKGTCYQIDYYEKVIPYKPMQFEDDIRTSGTSYYYAAFAQSGLSFQYVEYNNYKGLIMGAPGLSQWHGGIVIGTNINSPQASLSTYHLQNFEKYLGYSVVATKFSSFSNDIWYMTGAPRVNDLRGQVIIFALNSKRQNSMEYISAISNSESGEYFGASLLVEDVDGDGLKDIFVGAPMAAGKTFDEGAVYYYKQTFKKGTTQFELINKLVGNQSTQARFGTVMTSLGDINVDGYNDIAISAPYDNEGIGAIYIYKGSSEGIHPSKYEKISPLDLNLPLTKGFGLGLSRGNDINNDSFRDLAVGAYKSNTVYLLESKSVVDYQIFFESSESSLSIDSKNFNIKYCFNFTHRSRQLSKTSVQFKIQIVLDSRTASTENLTYNGYFIARRSYCKSVKVNIIKNTQQFTIPLKISALIESADPNVLVEGEQSPFLIPFSHKCGGDNICKTDLSVEVIVEQSTKAILLGATSDVQVGVNVENMGQEPAYRTELLFSVPDELEFLNTRSCNLQNQTYICQVADVIKPNNKNTIILNFYVKDIDINLKPITVKFNARHLGIQEYEDEDSITFPLELASNPFLQGKSQPEETFDYVINDDSKNEGLQLTHTYNVSNSGPSPFKLDFSIFLPQFIKGQQDISTILSTDARFKDISSSCKINYQPKFDFRILNKPIKNIDRNRTIDFNCMEKNDAKCIEIYCSVGLVNKLEKVDFSFTISPNFNILVDLFKEDLEKKDIIAITSTALFKNATNGHIFMEHVTSYIYIIKTPAFAYWILIVGLILGFLLLALLVFLLYKCHFFERNLKDKMQEEKSLSLIKNDANEDNLNEDSKDDDIFKSPDASSDNELVNS